MNQTIFEIFGIFAAGMSYFFISTPNVSSKKRGVQNAHAVHWLISRND